MSSRLLLIGLSLSLVFAIGCKKGPETPSAPTPTDVVSYTALAASDGIGFGGTVPCLPFDAECPGGTGYVYLLKRRLQSAGKTVTLNNRAVPGAVLSPAIQALARQTGRDDVLANFIEHEAPFVPANTTHVTIFAGGNDANAIGQAVRAGLAGGDVRGYIDQQVRQWAADYEDLIRRVRSRAANTRIVAINVPNLGAAPYVAGRPVEERSILQRISVGLADRVNALTTQNVLVVDLLCDPRITQASNFSSDGFHPNDQGYQLLADLTYPVLANGTASAPSSTCSQRTILPVF
jgi:lysophospholipase L1-like esterase